MQKCCYSATAQVNKTAWRDAGLNIKTYVPSAGFLNNFSMFSEAAEGPGNSWRCIWWSSEIYTDMYSLVGMIFLGKGDFALFGNNPSVFIGGKLASILRNIKHFRFLPSNIIYFSVHIFVIIIPLPTDSLLLFACDFRAIVLVLTRILYWSLLRANKATFCIRDL